MLEQDLSEILKMKVQSPFSIPMIMHKISDEHADEVENEFLKVESQFEKSEMLNTCLNDIKETIFDPTSISSFMQQLHTVRQKFYDLSKISHNPESLHFWTQDYLEGDGQIAHHHGTVGISGIYWIRADEGCSETVFHNPNPMFDYIPMDYGEISTPNFFQLSRMVLTPVKGTFVFFPSYLKHEVLMNPADKKRTTLSFSFGL